MNQLPERKTVVAKAQWIISVALDVEGLPLVEFDPIRLSDSWAAKNPNMAGDAVGKFIYERGTSKAIADARARKARKK